MRFAYIDSQGNEVPIPSVDALALRIELGAITPDTELYDAQADRWGAAKSHEIFHTLSRSSGEEKGFVAPPPPVAKTPKASAPEPPAPEEPAPPEPLTAERPTPPESSAEQASPEPPTVDEPAVEVEKEADDIFDLEMELADDLVGSGDPMPSVPEIADEVQSDSDEGEDVFDFGGMDALEMEEEEQEDEVEDAPEAQGEMEPPPTRKDGPDSGSLELEGGPALEPSTTGFPSDSPPAWMEQDGPSSEEDDDSLDLSGPMDFQREPEEEKADDTFDRSSAPSTQDRYGGDQEPAAEPAPRTTRRSRPSPPRRAKKKSPVGAIVAVVALLVLGGGGYVGWQAMQGGGGEALPEVVLPDIPPGLVPTMREVAEVALDSTIVQLAAMEEQARLPAEPRDDWLAGVYLANASQFDDVESYWVSISEFLDRVREVDARIFHTEYEAAMEARGISGDTARIILERADSGFLATRDQRFQAYSQMDDLVNASLDLHFFLLNNEESIEYTPAAGGMSADPVLEAVPATRELGNDMWSQVDRITAALDQLGTLERVSTERLMEVLFERIHSAGFR